MNNHPNNHECDKTTSTLITNMETNMENKHHYINNSPYQHNPNQIPDNNPNQSSKQIP
jgi:hypothetical protein